MKPLVHITEAPIDPAGVLAEVGAPEDGAVLLFLGTVRDHNEGRPVTGLHYQAYPEMAEGVLGEIVRAAVERFGTDRIAAVHRTGDLAVGDVAVAVAVSSHHRAEAFDAGRWVMEELKARLPIWKREAYVAGDEAWVRGVDPRSGPELSESGGVEPE